jgi:hypothetical protein
VVKAVYGRPRCRLRGAQILSSRLASPAVCNDVEGDLLPLVEATHTGAFDRADMNEDILVAALGLNESEAFLAVKQFPCSWELFLLVRGCSSRAITQPVSSRFWGEGRQSGALFDEAKSFGRNSINDKWLSHL